MSTDPTLLDLLAGQSDDGFDLSQMDPGPSSSVTGGNLSVTEKRRRTPAKAGVSEVTDDSDGRNDGNAAVRGNGLDGRPSKQEMWTKRILLTTSPSRSTR